MFIKRGQVYMVDFGKGHGSEQGGRRPCVIVQNDKGNQFSPTVIAAAITSVATKHPIPTHTYIQKGQCGLSKDSWILTEQLFTIDKTRLGNYLGRIGFGAMDEMNRALAISLGVKQ